MSDERLAPEFYHILEECLTAVQNGARTVDECLILYPQYADLLKRDLQMALLVGRLRSPRLPESGVRALEARLRQHARVGASGRILSFRPPASWGRAAAVVLAVVLIAFGAGGGAIHASADAVPGETLYTVKRAWEQILYIVAALTGTLDEFWVNAAETRLDEALQLAAGGSLDAEALLNLQQATRQAIEHADDTPSPALLAHLQRTYDALTGEALVVEGAPPIGQDIITLIEPVIQPQPPTATITPAVTPTPTLEPSPTPEFTVQVVIDPATLTPPPASPTPEPTITPRFPPTPTRTPTPTVTGTITPVPTLSPTVTRTPLPPPTLLALPTLVVPQPTLPAPGGMLQPSPTWYPWYRLTQDAFYLTRTAEASPPP